MSDHEPMTEAELNAAGRCAASLKADPDAGRQMRRCVNEIERLRGENAMLAMIVEATLEAALKVEAELDKVKGGA